MSEPVWHDVGHLLPPETPTDLAMAAQITREHRLEAIDRAEEQREQRRQQ